MFKKGQSEALPPGQEANHTNFFAICSSKISCTVRGTMTLWLRLKNDSDLCLTSALILAFSPGEKESTWFTSVCSTDHPANPAVGIAKDTGNVKALSLGRGLGEGGRCSHASFFARCSSKISCTVNSTMLLPLRRKNAPASM